MDWVLLEQKFSSGLYLVVILPVSHLPWSLFHPTTLHRDSSVPLKDLLFSKIVKGVYYHSPSFSSLLHLQGSTRIPEVLRLLPQFSSYDPVGPSYEPRALGLDCLSVQGFTEPVDTCRRRCVLEFKQTLTVPLKDRGPLGETTLPT